VYATCLRRDNGAETGTKGYVPPYEMYQHICIIAARNSEGLKFREADVLEIISRAAEWLQVSGLLISLLISTCT